MGWLKSFLNIFKEPERSEYYREGNRAYYAGINKDSCPYKDDPARYEWMSGYYRI